MSRRWRCTTRYIMIRYMGCLLWSNCKTAHCWDTTYHQQMLGLHDQLIHIDTRSAIANHLTNIHNITQQLYASICGLLPAKCLGNTTPRLNVTLHPRVPGPQSTHATTPYITKRIDRNALLHMKLYTDSLHTNC